MYLLSFFLEKAPCNHQSSPCHPAQLRAWSHSYSATDAALGVGGLQGTSSAGNSEPMSERQVAAGGQRDQGSRLRPQRGTSLVLPFHLCHKWRPKCHYSDLHSRELKLIKFRKPDQVHASRKRQSRSVIPLLSASKA